MAMEGLLMSKARIPRRYRVDKQESDRHLKQKIRLCKIFRDRGYFATCERRLPCFVELGAFTVRYRADCYATGGGGRIILCEVDGYKGHKSNRARMLQWLRLRRIREQYGEHIEEYRFTLKRLAKWTDEEIAEELRL